MTEIFGWVCQKTERHILLEYPNHVRTRKSLSEDLDVSERAYAGELQRIARVASRLADIRVYQAALSQRGIPGGNKAWVILIAINIGVTVITIVSLAVNIFSEASVPQWVGITALIFTGIGVIYMLAGGLVGLSARKRLRAYVPTAEIEVASRGRVLPADAFWTIRQNEQVLSMCESALSVAFLGIRNGMICVSIAAVLLILAALVT